VGGIYDLIRYDLIRVSLALGDRSKWAVEFYNGLTRHLWIKLKWIELKIFFWKCWGCYGIQIFLKIWMIWKIQL